jgi:transcriptional regulator with XRE-family HTH domain
VSEQLRRAIQTCGLTRAELSRLSGVPESGLSRFAAGEGELRTGNVDRLCKALGLTLTAKSGKSRKDR